MEHLGVVAIGRNEGERLRRCLESVVGDGRLVVYVDSGSTDDSLAMAKSLGVEVVELDLSIPFTAARARNEGWRRLCELDPELAFVQFLDGDCELQADWLPAAWQALQQDDGLAVACGRRRERFPEKTLLNRLCDMEWDTPIGEADACGGDALFRIAALREVDGFDDTSIAGEEPELCFRLRAASWRIVRLDVEMTLHDAAMDRFSQWWQRSKRAGHAYAGNFRRHSEAGFRKGQLRSAWFWGAAVPLGLIAFSMLLHPWGWLAWLVYPLQVLRVALGLRHGHGDLPLRWHLIYAAHCIASKFPHVAGILDERSAHRQGRIALIEYK
ncbi:MAG: glycosyltransferase [Planctomycetota bacterium]